MCYALVVLIPGIKGSVEIHSEAADLAYRAVFIHDDNPVALDSKTFSKYQLRWRIHEMEVMAIVQVLHWWRHCPG